MAIMTQVDLENLVNQLSLQYFDKPYKDDVVFNFRLRTTGGRYIPKFRKIELNPKYLEELDFEEFCGIIKHELCHYHLHIEGKGYNHRDREFRELLQKTGSPRFCNPLPSMKKKPTHQYKCINCGHVYERMRSVNIQKYRCGKCQGKLKKI